MDLDQKITAMKLWHLSLPVLSRRDHGIGTVEGACEIIVVSLTSEGGTLAGAKHPLVGLHRLTRSKLCSTRPIYTSAGRGKKNWRPGRNYGRCRTRRRARNRSKTAVDTALLDLTGQILNTPAWALLGGKCRDTILCRFQSLTRTSTTTGACWTDWWKTVSAS